MPDIDTKMHLNMFRKWKERKRLLPRILGAIRREIQSKDVYGLQWGNPDVATPLKFIRDRYVLPYVNCEHCAIEIGPGGGRWTRYLLGFGKLYAVDYYSEILKALKKNFNLPNMVFIKNNGTDFPGIDANTIDYRLMHK